MAERMVGFLKWDSPDEEVWINPRHLVLVHQPGEGATLEFVEGKTVTVEGTPAKVAAALAGEPKSGKRAWVEPDESKGAGGAPVMDDDKVIGSFIARVLRKFAAGMPNAEWVPQAEPPRDWLHVKISGDDLDGLRMVRAMLHHHGHLVDAYTASPAFDGTVLRMDLGFNDKQARQMAAAKLGELALGAMVGGAGAIPDSIAASFPVEMGWLTSEETVHLIDAFEEALMSRDLQSAAKVQLVAALQDHVGDDGSGVGERRFRARDAVEKVQRMTDQQCEWLRGWVYGWYDGAGEPEDDPGAESS